MQAVAHPQVVATMPQLQDGTLPPRTSRSHPLYVHRLRRGSRSQADCHRPCLVWRLQGHDDDVLLPACGASRFVGPRVIITEKLDGANCCLQRGEVYARTHSHAATHASFGPGV